MLQIIFKHKETGEKIYIDADDFENFNKFMSDENWVLVFE